MPPYQLSDISRLPAPGDNTAIATRRLPAGTTIDLDGSAVATDYDILEGHRFAVAPIGAGEALLSWGLPFGYALREVRPGAYLHNQRMLDALRLREVGFALPSEPNFRDTALAAYVLDESRVVASPSTPVVNAEERRTFEGYGRGSRRGVGTRNYIVVLATTSRTSSWARALEERLAGTALQHAGVDGVVAVSHTEGGADTPNNLDLLLRTLAGFAVHPNVGAVLIVDHGDEAVTGSMLRDYLRANDYPLDEVPHRFVTLRDTFDADLDKGVALVEGWLPTVAACERTPQPLSALKLGLQCGGSDSFSGISGNPLAAWAARAVVQHGGAANLAETDELIGAEEYLLSNVRDIETARRFLATIERFKDRVAWHGHTAEGNPSGGNLYRGLYNIAIKSIGAAMKRDPEVRLDHVIDYGQPMAAPGYYFMDSPGNDLESIAGQVASGSNFMLFVTGNGSITNFPFVPTIKIVTTTERFRLLESDMDINAGAYLDGTPMDVLGAGLVNSIVAAASGERTKGERAGHAQVSIWRDWPQSGPVDLATVEPIVGPSGVPLLDVDSMRAREMSASERELALATYEGLLTPTGAAIDQIGLVLPTSLCSGEVARRIAQALNERHADDIEPVLSRFVALPHTEGCGVSSGSSEEIFVRTLVGHLLHPSVGAALLLEHGCEKTHNDYLRNELRRRGVDSSRFGWASIQLDGGIDAVQSKVEEYFTAAMESQPRLVTAGATVDDLRVGIAAAGAIPPVVSAALASVARTIVSAGGVVITPECAAFLRHDDEWREQFGVDAARPSLPFAATPETRGLHLMETPGTHWVETLTGLGATGVDLVLAYSGTRPLQAHRMIPVLQVTAAHDGDLTHFQSDFDIVLAGEPVGWPRQIVERIVAVAGRQYQPRFFGGGNTAFQISRGRLGVSM